ncbi:uncharacterized protein MKK02DRAFT_39085 [Dioszegia hungarica]|uniref:F-box domain-containing protein n=1 Tax=Dioszegia hungarica TaxID=4972 RepID=A0AA38LRP8_9TREE|nr:uncharacterized protein MKK02DRAFT_39085 [Dioszegia hungarica]KAI9633390.1 hypothetical protein MKK02DRAFT_39085 [Dioszegia hungarica]
MSKMPAPTLPAPASLTSLPAEILLNIVLQLDLPTALSLACASSALTSIADHRIWQVVAATDRWRDFSDSQYTSFEEREARVKQAHARLLDTILERIDGRRKGLIKCLSILIRTETDDATMRILSLAASTVRRLRIDGGSWTWSTSFDSRVLDTGLSLLRLSYLNLGEACVCNAEFVLLMLSAAPNLEVLDIHLSDTAGHAGPQYPALTGSTKLRNLQIYHDWRSKEEESITRMRKVIFAILNHSPLLEVLVMDMPDLELQRHAGPRPLAILPLLARLHYTSHTALFGRNVPLLQTPVLSQIVVDVRVNLNLALDFPACPNVEVLGFDCSLESAANTVNDIPFLAPCPVQSIPSHLAARLRDCSRLRYILIADNTALTRSDEGWNHFSVFSDGQTPYTGFVRSFRHNGSEMLHLRVLLRESTEMPYGGDGVPVVQWVPLIRSEPALPGRTCWQDFTDWEGQVVPMAILGQMRRKEAGKADWYQRGVEVPAPTWKILEDWRDGLRV